MKAPTVWRIQQLTPDGKELEDTIKIDNFFRKGQEIVLFQIVNNILRIVYKNPRLPQFNIPVFDIQRGTYEKFCKVNYRGKVWSLSCSFRELYAIEV